MSSPVMLVDDDEFARGFVRTVLERAGFTVIEAEDVAGALVNASASPPIAVVTDWNLPDGDGGDLARLLHASTVQLPVILITGDGSLVDLMSARDRCEFTAVLSKPFSPSLLERAVRDAIAC